jgi:RNA polymerase sigma factor (sigma-70 family)
MTTSMPGSLLRALPDGRLAELAATGQDRAFEVLVNRHRSELMRHCRRLRLSDGTAEDVVQQALMSAWAALRRGSQVREPRAWLHQIVHHAALRAIAASEPQDELSDTLAGPGSLESWVETRATVHQTLSSIAALPAQQRDALLGTAADGMSHDQVAQIMGVTPQAVRGLVYRARMTMRASMAAIFPAPLVNWMLGSGSETVAGGGAGAGILGLLLKGGAAGVAAVVLATAAGGGHSSGSHRTLARVSGAGAGAVHRAPAAHAVRALAQGGRSAETALVTRLPSSEPATSVKRATSSAKTDPVSIIKAATNPGATKNHVPTLGLPTLPTPVTPAPTRPAPLSLKTLIPAVEKMAGSMQPPK